MYGAIYMEKTMRRVVATIIDCSLWSIFYCIIFVIVVFISKERNADTIIEIDKYYNMAPHIV